MPGNQINMLKTESHPSHALSELIRSKTMVTKNAPLKTIEAPRSIDVMSNSVDRRQSWYYKYQPKAFAPAVTGPEIPTALSMTSRMSFFTDRIIQPERKLIFELLFICVSYPCNGSHVLG